MNIFKFILLTIIITTNTFAMRTLTPIRTFATLGAAAAFKNAKAEEKSVDTQPISIETLKAMLTEKQKEYSSLSGSEMFWIGMSVPLLCASMICFEDGGFFFLVGGVLCGARGAALGDEKRKALFKLIELQALLTAKDPQAAEKNLRQDPINPEIQTEATQKS